MESGNRPKKKLKKKFFDLFKTKEEKIGDQKIAEEMKNEILQIKEIKHIKEEIHDKTGSLKPHNVFFAISKNKEISIDIYRFVIDGALQDSFCIEEWEAKEPGSLTAMFNGWLHIIETFANNTKKKEVISAKYLKKIHQIIAPKPSDEHNKVNEKKIPEEMLNKVDNLQVENKKILKIIKNYKERGQFRVENTTFPYNKKGNNTVYDDPEESDHDYGNVTVMGLEEIKIEASAKNYIGNKINKSIKIINNEHRIGLDLDDISENKRPKILEEIVESILKIYRHQIKNAKNDYAKLVAIAICTRRLEIIHPFRDYNSRTISVLFLNSLLMLEGFPPIILANPNRFDGYAITELVRDIIRGMGNTLALLKQEQLFQKDFTDEYREDLNTEPGPDAISDDGLEILRNIAQDYYNKLDKIESNKQYRI